MSDIVIYEDGNVELKTTVKNMRNMLFLKHISEG